MYSMCVDRVQYVGKAAKKRSNKQIMKVSIRGQMSLRIPFEIKTNATPLYVEMYVNI